MTKAAASRQGAKTETLLTLPSSYTVAISTKNTSLQNFNGGSLQLTATLNVSGGASLSGSFEPLSGGQYTVEGYLDSTQQLVFTVMIGDVPFSLTGTVYSNGTKIKNGGISLPPQSLNADFRKPVNDVGEGTWTAQSGGGNPDPD